VDKTEERVIQWSKVALLALAVALEFLIYWRH